MYKTGRLELRFPACLKLLNTMNYTNTTSLQFRVNPPTPVDWCSGTLTTFTVRTKCNLQIERHAESLNSNTGGIHSYHYHINGRHSEVESRRIQWSIWLSDLKKVKDCLRQRIIWNTDKSRVCFSRGRHNTADTHFLQFDKVWQIYKASKGSCTYIPPPPFQERDIAIKETRIQDSPRAIKVDEGWRTNGGKMRNAYIISP